MDAKSTENNTSIDTNEENDLKYDASTNLASNKCDNGNEVVEICFSFDTTGSMYKWLEEVKTSLRNIVKDLFSKIPNIKISLIAHGDYCDEKTTYVLKCCSFTRNENQLIDFVNTAGRTGGGDAPECYEYVLWYVSNKLEWGIHTKSKILVMIGDANPHEPNYKLNTMNIDWREQLQHLRQKGIICYTICCNRSNMSFWETVSRTTYGKCLELTNIKNITKLFIALCLSTSSSDQFQQFADEIMQSNDVNDELIELQNALRKLGTWIPSIVEVSNETYKHNAKRRIMRDLCEIKRENYALNGINAVCLENNLFECHANMCAISGILKDIIFHLVIQFPDNYPLTPPKIKVMTYFNHPNVFDNKYICLDMLTSNTKTHRYTGWTAGYSLYSILCQLQTFLFSENIQQEYGKVFHTAHFFKTAQKRMLNESKKFNCSQCGHKYISPYPSIKICKQKQNTNKIQINNDEAKRNYFFKYVCKENELIILSYLQICDCIMLSKTCIHFETLIKCTNKIQMDKYRCWYHRIDLSCIHEEDNKDLILGYGITPKIYGQDSIFKCGFKKREVKYTDDEFECIEKEIVRFPMLQTVSTTFDLLSKNAFEQFGVRYTLWKDMSFTHWIPIYIVKQHGEKSLILFEKICIKIFGKREFHPYMGLHLIAMIMNSIVVDCMKAYDIVKNRTNLYHSINLFECYFHFYHLLLAFYQKNEDILKPFIYTKCANFIRDPNLRKKSVVPNMGEFLIYFTLWNKSWDYISQSILAEVFIRRCKWVVDSYPEIVVINDRKREINIHFKASKISNRLLLFQYFFLKHCCQIGSIKTPNDKFKEFNANFGCVSPKLPGKFQLFIKQVYTIGSYNDVFKMIEMKCYENTQLWQWLRRSMRASYKRHYHNIPYEYRINKSKKNNDEETNLNTLRKKLKGKKNRYDCYNNNAMPNVYIHRKRRKRSRQ